jgi:hypothetical protein
MSLRKQFQLRKGTVSLGVFKDEHDGKVLVSFDKDFVSRRVKGPLFTEGEMYDLIEVIKDYDEWESTVVHGKANRALAAGPQFDTAETSDEIQAAILQASKVEPKAGQQSNPVVTSAAKITVVPSLPKFRYVYTCPRCAGHVARPLGLPSGAALLICSFCTYVYKVIG